MQRRMIIITPLMFFLFLFPGLQTRAEMEREGGREREREREKEREREGGNKALVVLTPGVRGSFVPNE